MKGPACDTTDNPAYGTSVELLIIEPVLLYYMLKYTAVEQRKLYQVAGQNKHNDSLLIIGHNVLWLSDQITCRS